MTDKRKEYSYRLDMIWWAFTGLNHKLDSCLNDTEKDEMADIRWKIHQLNEKLRKEFNGEKS